MIWTKKDDTLTKMLARMITELVAQRQDIGALKLQLEEMSKSREQMYARLLDAFIKVVSPVSGLGKASVASSFSGGLFDEVPLGDKEGYKETELNLEDE